MSHSILSRRTRSQEVSVSTTVASSTTLDMRDMAAGMVHVSDVTGTATIAVYGSRDSTSFVPLYSHDGQAATITVPASGGSAPLPDAAYALRYVRLVAATELGTAATTLASLKS